VLLADLERFGSPVAEYVAGKTIADALGRIWVSDDVARAALAKAESTWQAEIADRNAYARFLDDRAERRRALAEKIHNDVLGGSTATPAGSGVIHGRLQEVLGEFDEREPELGFYEWRDSRPQMKAARA
jgi:hypothetical protein